MSSGSYRQTDVLCPFYMTDDGKNRISCEGIGNGSSLTSYFRTRSEYARQLEVFCCEHYARCEISRAIMEKYTDGEDKLL